MFFEFLIPALTDIGGPQDSNRFSREPFQDRYRFRIVWLVGLIFNHRRKVFFMPLCELAGELQGDQVGRLRDRFATGKREFCAAENAVKSVIIFRGDRVVFVVMASGTTDCHSKECLPDVINNIFVHEVDVFVDVMSVSS